MTPEPTTRVHLRHRVTGTAIFSLDVDSKVPSAIHVGMAVKAALEASVDLRYAYLRDANLSYAELSGADLRYADMRCADLSYAVMTGAELNGADLRYADLTGAKVTGADLRGAELDLSR